MSCSSGWCSAMPVRTRRLRRALKRVKLNTTGPGAAACIVRGFPEPGMGPVELGPRPERSMASRLCVVWVVGVVTVRVIIPTWDKTLPTVIACLDRAMRLRRLPHY